MLSQLARFCGSGIDYKYFVPLSHRELGGRIFSSSSLHAVHPQVMFALFFASLGLEDVVACDLNSLECIVNPPKHMLLMGLEDIPGKTDEVFQISISLIFFLSYSICRYNDIVNCGSYFFPGAVKTMH